MRGSIQRRGRQSWRLKFDVERTGGKRDTRLVTFRGSRKEAQTKLAELIASLGRGSYVEPSKITVAAFVRARVDQWEAGGDITARTAQRYRQLAENQIVPHIGATPMQKLTRLDVEGWHTTLRNGGLAPRTRPPRPQQGTA
jgi:integrase